MKDYNIEPYIDNNSQRSFEEEEAYIRAKKKLDKIIGFYWHLASYLVVNIVLLYIIYVNTESGFWSFGSFSTAIFWGIGLFFHFLGVFGRNYLFSKAWEDRKIAEYMEDEKRRWE
ncbi:2TM domain-containing protein [Lacinutrix sp.]|uniref:2TM domain-containing protein n=1 Tax=Lacinutrix sp. TaxID=1937692 RepID=UPI002604951D|nr:2TM domain-containing protein [Lacinutrix sp.]MDG1715287.1 2TM domain-containing protein [Lacinutrix sp.]